MYHYSFPEDNLKIKILSACLSRSPHRSSQDNIICFAVWFVYILELAQVGCAAGDIYYWFGSGYGNMVHLDTVFISPFDTPFIGSIVAFVVQLFFCYRIWKLRKGDWYIVMCVIIALVRCGNRL